MTPNTVTASLKALRVSAATTRLGGFGGALFLALLFVVTFQFIPGRYQLVEGDVSPYTIKAPNKVTYASQIRTREEKTRAAAAVSEVYVLDSAVVDTQRQKLVDALRQIGDARHPAGSVEPRRDVIVAAYNPPLRAQSIDDILALSDSEWQAVSNDAQRVFDIVMRGRITEAQVEQVRNVLPAYTNSSLAERQASLVVQLVLPLLRANFVLDQDATARARQEAQDRVQPVRVTIERGETILRDGDVVRPLDLERLEAAGLRNPSIDWRSLGATALLLVLFTLVLVLFIRHFRPELQSQPRALLLLGLLVAVTVLTMKLVVPGRDLWSYGLPVAAPVMLVALLLGADLAIVVNLVLAACLGLIAGNSFEMTTVALLGGFAGTMLVWRFERLNTFFLAGVCIAIVNFLSTCAFALLAGDVDARRFALLAAIAAMNGMLSAALTLGTLAAIGHLFGITTTLGLLELAHPTQPLFRRLLTEAPGTYHHSIVVANLAERAAEAIGADALLCRVAAYYHDVGKIIRPYAFIENQVPGDNIHDRLDPATSARMIAAHVPDGLALAKRYRLPDRVRDMIAQHHGTAFVGTFYQRAVKAAGNATIDQAGFRYEGPKPRSREAAILMLADGVEAAVRASRDHAPDVIEQLVRKIFSDRLADGQLDECGLTLGDMDRVRQVFVRVLRAMFHPRITYPDYPAEATPATAPVVASAASVDPN